MPGLLPSLRQRTCAEAYFIADVCVFHAVALSREVVFGVEIILPQCYNRFTKISFREFYIACLQKETNRDGDVYGSS